MAGQVLREEMPEIVAQYNNQEQQMWHQILFLFDLTIDRVLDLQKQQLCLLPG